jgi:hypothetical protein
MVARGLQRMDADLPLRKKLSALGVKEITDSIMLEWSGSGARLRSILNGAESSCAADSLVLSMINVPNDELVQALQDSEHNVIAIGDCVASRSAVMAIYEGRATGLKL